MRWFRFAPLGLVAIMSVAAVLVTVQLRPPPVVEPPLELSATLELRRSIQEPHTVAIAVTNLGKVPVRIRAAELVTDSLEATGPIEVDEVEVPTEAAPRDVFIHYGMARCDGELAPAGRPAVAWLEVSSGGDWQRVEVPLEHPNGTLDRMVGQDCAGQYLAERVTVGFGPWQEAPDGKLRGDIVLERVTGDAPIIFEAVAGNPHFLVTADQPRAELPSGQARLEIPVTAEPNRCDGHALAESKKPYLFPAWLSIDEHEKIPTVITVTETDQTRLDQMQFTLC